MILALALALAPLAADPPAPDPELMREVAEQARQAAHASEMAARQLSELSRLLHPEAATNPEHWTFSTGLRLENISGNARALASGIDSGASGRWGAWGTDIKLSYAYGRTLTNGARTVTANNAALTLRGDREYSWLLSNYVLVGGMFDRVASIHHQGFGEAGLGLTWINDVVENVTYHLLRTDLGFRTTQEGRRNFYPKQATDSTALGERWLYQPTATLTYRYRLNRHVYVTEEAQGFYIVERRPYARFSSETALNVQLNSVITIALLGKVRYIGQPPVGRRPTDTSLSTVLNLAW